MRPRREDGALDAEALNARCRGLERAVAVATDRLPSRPVDSARKLLTRAGERMSLAGDLTVVALAGPTGAGKSSLFNALVGAPLATVAAIRPTTDQPAAALWTPQPGAAALLDWLEVRRWHVVEPPSGPDPLTGLVLLDLPDHDSTVAAHRELADRIVERADVMVWVLDPQKYADAVVHDRYLVNYARHTDVTLVLLNQSDRLAPPDVRACLAHLSGLLAADGLPDARVIAVSARTQEGLPELREALGAVVSQRQASLDRLAADIAAAADDLETASGDQGAPTTSATAGARGRLADALADAAGVPLVEKAVAASVRRAGVQATGWPPVRWVVRLRPDPAARLRLSRSGVDPALVHTSLPSASPVAMAEVSTAARTYAVAATQGCPPAWLRSARALAVSAAEGIGPHLDAAVARAEVRAPRAPLWWRAVGGLQLLLVTAAAAGLIWLGALAGLNALALVAPEPPRVGAVPVPTLLLGAGVVGGLVLALLARWATGITAARAARRARAAVVAEVEQVARQRILEPVEAEAASLGEFRLGLLTARGN